MALLNRFLKLLEMIEGLSEAIAFLSTPVGIAVGSCLISYEALLLIGCDAISASILAGTLALTLHSVLEKPDF